MTATSKRFIKMGSEDRILNHRHQKVKVKHFLKDLQNNTEHDEVTESKSVEPTPLSIQQSMKDRIEVKGEDVPEKLHRIRNSLLTDLVDLPYMHTIVVFALVISIHICVIVAVEDVFMFSRLPLGIPGFINFLTNIYTSASIWMATFLFTFTTYFGFCAWAQSRLWFYDKPTQLQRYDKLCVWTWFLSNTAVGTYIALYILYNPSKVVVPMLVSAEMIRMMMKVYAFVRSNAPRVLKSRQQDDFICPKFSQFLYFLFAPTLLYKDEYPRTKQIRWNFVALHFSISILGIMCTYFIYDYVLVPSVAVVDLKTITVWQFVSLSSRNVFPAFLHTMCTFTVLLHSWQNAFAEMLRFGDRLFYKDWWNSTSYADYYRKWNTIVHDFIYTYIYQDMYNIVTSKNQAVSKTTVIFLSSFLHEVVLSASYGFVYPIFSLFYLVIGVPASYIKFKNPILGNVLFLYTYTLTMGSTYTGWILEYRARQECPTEETTFTFWICRGLRYWTYCD